MTNGDNGRAETSNCDVSITDAFEKVTRMQSVEGNTARLNELTRKAGASWYVRLPISATP